MTPDAIVGKNKNKQTELQDKPSVKLVESDSPPSIQPEEALQALLVSAANTKADSITSNVDEKSNSTADAEFSSTSAMESKSNEDAEASFTSTMQSKSNTDAEASFTSTMESNFNPVAESDASNPSTSETVESNNESTDGSHIWTQLPILKKFALDQVMSVRAPVMILLLIGLMPKAVLLWVAIIVFKPACSWIYKHSSLDFQLKLRDKIPAKVRHSPLIRDFGEGADQGLSFVLFWAYMFCAPFSMLWIFGHYVKGWLPKKPEKINPDEFVFAQNQSLRRGKEETNFYHSKALSLVIIGFFALGIPAFASIFLFEKLGIESDLKEANTHRIRTSYQVKNTINTQNRTLGTRYLMSRNKKPPRMTVDNAPAFVVLDDVPPTGVDDQRKFWPALQGFTLKTNKFNVFLAHFYLAGLGSAFAVLFLRAWFLFPLNFVGDEHNIYITARGVRRSQLKNWFLNVLTINRFTIGGGPDSLKWDEIKSLRKAEDGPSKLYPLPESAFKKESLTYRLLNKFAMFVDGMNSRAQKGNYLVFSGANEGSDFGRNLRLNLNDLSREQRAKLFYAVKQWAPQVAVSDAVQEELLGSTVLKDVRYTQLWFDLFTTRSAVKRQTTLNSGESLKDGDYIIQQRLNSGGQATAYLAHTASGAKCVLKEFILADSSTTPGALLESAREFENEVALLSQLNHPGIVNLIDFFTDGGRVYVVLEYIDGETLRQRVTKNGDFSEIETARIALAVAEVLKYLHSLDPPIVHRDVTPENILIAPDGSIKLIDFSLAEKTDGRTTTDSCGKQSFTPPEQFREEACPQSDIYGLGATMFFMLTGSVPKPISVSSPRKKLATVSKELDAIVQRATQLDLSERYDGAEWLQLELAKFITSSDSSSRSGSES
ncbi:MAG TPA: serine/threonine-protein kinase [Drouetiella sp.]